MNRLSAFAGALLALVIGTTASSQINDRARTEWRALSAAEQRARIAKNLDGVRADVAANSQSGSELQRAVTATFTACLNSEALQTTGVERLRSAIDEHYKADRFACYPTSQLIFSALRIVCAKEFAALSETRTMPPPPLPPACN